MIEILQKAKEVLSDETKWTKHVFAKDAKGHKVHYSMDEAVCFCLLGAIGRAVCNTKRYDSYIRVMTEIDPDNTLDIFNDADDTKYSDVIEWLDKRIAWYSGSDSHGVGQTSDIATKQEGRDDGEDNKVS